MGIAVDLQRHRSAPCLAARAARSCPRVEKSQYRSAPQRAQSDQEERLAAPVAMLSQSAPGTWADHCDRLAILAEPLVRPAAGPIKRAKRPAVRSHVGEEHSHGDPY
jgi:hypothetical protein